MAVRTVTSVKKSCDTLWSRIINSFGRCEYCGKTPTQAHHVYGRANHRLRFDLRNGIALCYYCHHIWAEQNAAGEKRPMSFSDWFKQYRISDAQYLQEENAKGTIHRDLADYLELEEYLKQELERVRD